MTILRRMIVLMAALTGVMGLIAGNALASTEHTPTLNKCGPRAHTAKQWRSNAMRNDTWAHVVGIVRKNAKKYSFHPVDGDTIDIWYNRQAVVLRSARAQRIPNTGCTAAGEVQNIHDKLVPKNWLLNVVLPDRLTKKDIHPTKTRYYNKRKVAWFYFLGQPSCINGTSKAKKVQVFYFVHVKVKAKKPAPKPKPKPKKPAPKPLAPICITTAGVPLYTLPGGVTSVNGVCTTTTTTTTETCKEGFHQEGHDQAGNVICVQNTNTNTNTNTVNVPVTVVVNTPPTTCNCTQPPVVVPPPPVVVTPPPVTFTMSFDTINDIPAGICRPETLHVTSSVAGQVQVRPDRGLISTVDCYRPNNERLSMVTLPVKTGSQDLTVYVYEPNDPSATSDTLTAVPLIAGVDAKSNTATTSFTISHPVRS